MRPSHDYAARAYEREKVRDWRGAEEQYLLAAQSIATSKLVQDIKDRKLYDAAAKRCRRLATIEGAKP